MSKFLLNKQTGELFHQEGSHGGPDFKIDWEKREVYYQGKKVQESSARPQTAGRQSEPGAEATIQAVSPLEEDIAHASRNLGRKVIRSMEQPLMAQVRDPHVASREDVEKAVKNPEFFHQRPTEIARAEMADKEADLSDEKSKGVIREKTVQHLRLEGQPGEGHRPEGEYPPARSLEDIADAMKEREKREVGVTTEQERESDVTLAEGADEDARRRQLLADEAKRERDVSPPASVTPDTGAAADTAKIKEDDTVRPQPKADLFSGLKPKSK